MADVFELSVPTDFSFPFVPYGIQQEFMRALFQVVEQRKIGIFESPTGTGKSLSLICSSLSWLKANRQRTTDAVTNDLLIKLRQEFPNEPGWVLEQHVERKRQELLDEDELLEQRLQALREQESQAKQTSSSSHPAKKQRTLNDADYSDSEFAPEEDEIGPNGLPRSVQAMLDKYSSSKPQYQEIELEPDCTKIYFTSRTHSQLSQFIGEIRKTSFKDNLRVITLGSRSNLCINRDIRGKAKSLEAINEACMNLQKSDKEKRCPHLPSPDEQDRLNQFRDYALARIHDIEELADLGRMHNCCPYYGSRKAIRRAQVVTLPYNLLLQSSSREALGIALNNNIVIIDEAHNLIDSILAIYTVSLSNHLLNQTKDAFSIYVKRFARQIKGSNLVHLKHLLRVCECLLKFSDSWSSNVPPSKLRCEEITTVNNLLNETQVLDQLNVLELERYLQESKIINKVAGYAVKIEQTQNPEAFEKGFQTRSAFITAFYKIRSFITALSNANEDGRVLLTLERRAPSEVPTVALKYQLLNPSSSFEDLVSQPRSVVLAGGTMAPLSDFQLQLFPSISSQKILNFSCSHIVPPEHLLVRAVSKGPMGSKLELKFTSKDDIKLLDDIGQSIVNISNIVKYGIVCFFPSYSILENLTRRWRSTALWDRLEKKKKIFIEPERAGDVDKILSGYAVAIDSPPSPRTGAMMFAVIGGKLSEGINFSDNLCRAVVVIGIPYPNLQSIEVKERIKYVEGLKETTKDAGKTFYANLAFKAVNQSIGRAIRHAKDWSAIVLLDARYAHEENVGRLPTWIQSAFKTSDTFGLFMKDVAQFYHCRTQRAA